MKKGACKRLTEKELLHINGGHKGFLYTVGWIAAENVLFTLGILAGISEGFDSGIEEK